MLEKKDFVPFFTGPQIQGAFVCDLLEGHEIPYHIHDQSYQTSTLIAYGYMDSKVEIFVPGKMEDECRRLLEEHLSELPGGDVENDPAFRTGPEKEINTMREALYSPESKNLFRKVLYLLLTGLALTLILDYFSNGGFWRDLL